MLPMAVGCFDCLLPLLLLAPSADNFWSALGRMMHMIVCSVQSCVGGYGEPLPSKIIAHRSKLFVPRWWKNKVRFYDSMVVFSTRSKASNTLALLLLCSGGVGWWLFDQPVLDSVSVLTPEGLVGRRIMFSCFWSRQNPRPSFSSGGIDFGIYCRLLDDNAN
jgi:hypothetical protein